MLILILTLLAVLLAVIFGLLARRGDPNAVIAEREGASLKRRTGFNMAAIAAVLIAVFLFASTSYVVVGPNEAGHLKRIYGGSDLPTGKIIAIDGQKGPQADLLGPGFHFIPFVNVLNQVEQLDLVTIPNGSYGRLVAKDGLALPSGVFMAPAIPDDKVAGMLDARTFLTSGGLRGAQETVLKPGVYRLNRYLFDVEINNRTVASIVPAGFVGVIKSNVAAPGVACREEKVQTADTSDAIVVPVVPMGCVGIWRSVLLPGAYYLNHQAYEMTQVDTRVQTWEYRGGFRKRIIDLAVDDQGRIRQVERFVEQPTPKGAADEAIFVKIEGWDIPVELRVVVQVPPENAPVVVGGVGGLEQIEDRILTPTIRSIVRNVAGSSIRVPVRNAAGELAPGQFQTRPTRVLDLIDNRDALESTIEQQIRIEGRKAGIEIKEVRMGEPSIPPELLVSRLREQLAEQLSRAYSRETEAQKVRLDTEAARARADQQREFVAAQIGVQVAEQRQKERQLLGQAERGYLEELAKGQNAQANVLGQDRVAYLQALEKVLATLEKKPELVNLVGRLVPNTVVTGGGDGLAGAAALLSSALTGAGTPARNTSGAR
ncbi:SPFH domain-containing protein [Bosea sp. LjRoot237]|uniref:SPFH domain-containing protein n=1 Tax=Bosea sp. LjRoot237 TaxID=3342292 RepID=UPI003F4FBB93